jgi:hypothetical protein
MLELGMVGLLRGEWRVGGRWLAVEIPEAMTVLTGDPFNGHFDFSLTLTKFHRLKLL